MTCPFYSENSGRSVCQAYGSITNSKKEDCLGQYIDCYNKARKSLEENLRDSIPGEGRISKFLNEPSSDNLDDLIY